MIHSVRTMSLALLAMGTAIPAMYAHAQAGAAMAEAALGQADAADKLRSDAKASLAQMPPGPNGEREEVLRLLTQALSAGARAASRAQ